MAPAREAKKPAPKSDVVEEPVPVEHPDDPARCPHAAQDRTQCVLAEGHEGEHQTRFQATT